MDARFLGSSHRRWNPLKWEWVLVSPNRTQRPWQGHVENITKTAAMTYDPACYLCPGNLRSGGIQTPQYSGPFVFENDFPALNRHTQHVGMNVGDGALIHAETERGVCRVMCFDPRHDLTLATMDRSAICGVVDMWCKQALELGSLDDIRYVQIFENRGQMMGASNSHPHGQIWATQHLPNESSLELTSQKAYYAEHKWPLLSAYLELELKERERLVIENSTWAALVPFWAVWPFELLLLPKRPTASLAASNDEVRHGLADVLQRVTRAYNRVFETPFPYSMGLHPAPCDGLDHPEWLLHLHFYPPLLRSATIRKFMVGFELLGSPQRDITPEASAQILRIAMEKTQ